MAFDYTTLASVKTLGPITGTADDALLASIITAYSREVDKVCRQVFSQTTYTDAIYPAKVDAHGLLNVWLPVPTVTLSAAAYRDIRVETWNTLQTTDAYTEDRIYGAWVLFRAPLLPGLRAARVQAQLTYTGGWANLAAVPADFELLVRRLVWWAYKKKDAPVEKIGMPDMGILITPTDWPADIRRGLDYYTRKF